MRKLSTFAFFLTFAIALLAAINLFRNPEVSSRLGDIETSGWPGNMELRVLTYNVYDLPLMSSNRRERMQAAGEFIRDQALDLVALQEAFVESDRQALLDSLGDDPLANYNHYFPSGLAGSGLMILSRYPIHSRSFLRFSNNGKWYKIHHGDWWAGKGVAAARIEFSSGKYLDLYNAHLQAEYRPSPPFEYTMVRLGQAQEMSEHVLQNRSTGVPQLLAGDLNFTAGSPEYLLAEDMLKIENFTNPETEIDYILGLRGGCVGWELLDAMKLEPTARISGSEQRLSDHSAFLSILRISEDLNGCATRE